MAALRATSRTERTRTALIGAGRRLYSERSIDAVTVDDIVQLAAVGKGSFYNHFDGREDLAQAVAAEARSIIEASISKANAGVADPAHRMARAVCTYFRFALDHAESAGVLIRLESGSAVLSTSLNRGLVQDIETGLASGRFAISTVEAGVLLVLGVTQLALVRVTQEPTLSFAVPLSQQMCTLILKAFSLAPSEAELVAAQASDEIVRKGPAVPFVAT